MPQLHSAIVSLDVGSVRVGVAVASIAVRLPRPLTTLKRDDHFFDKLKELLEQEDCSIIVVGYPRGLQGQVTKQTSEIEAFAEELKQKTQLPLQFQDESLTSVAAESELENRGKTYKRGDVDSLAATYILEDFLNEHQVLMENQE